MTLYVGDRLVCRFGWKPAHQTVTYMADIYQMSY